MKVLIAIVVVLLQQGAWAGNPAGKRPSPRPTPKPTSSPVPNPCLTSTAIRAADMAVMTGVDEGAEVDALNKLPQLKLENPPADVVSKMKQSNKTLAGVAELMGMGANIPTYERRIPYFWSLCSSRLAYSSGWSVVSYRKNRSKYLYHYAYIPYRLQQRLCSPPNQRCRLVVGCCRQQYTWAYLPVIIRYGCNCKYCYKVALRYVRIGSCCECMANPMLSTWRSGTSCERFFSPLQPTGQRDTASP